MTEHVRGLDEVGIEVAKMGGSPLLFEPSRGSCSQEVTYVHNSLVNTNARCENKSLGYGGVCGCGFERDNKTSIRASRRAIQIYTSASSFSIVASILSYDTGTRCREPESASTSFSRPSGLSAPPRPSSDPTSRSTEKETHRLGRGREPLPDLSVLIDEELAEVPDDPLPHESRLLVLEEREDRVRVGPVDVRLGRQGEGDAVVELAERLDLVVRAGLCRIRTGPSRGRRRTGQTSGGAMRRS